MAKNNERLKYLGPVSSFSVIIPAPEGSDKEPESNDRALVTGKTYDDLPADHPVIKNLKAHGLLVPDLKEPAITVPPTPPAPPKGAEDESIQKEGNSK